MTKHKPQIMVLCEDKHHFEFIRGFLLAAGWKDRAFLPPNLPPAGRVAAEHWVRSRYRQVLTTLKSKIGQGRSLLLIVMIDADQLTVNERLAQFQNRDRNTSVFFIPKRNIESWFYFIDHVEINEHDSFRVRYQKRIKAKRYGQQTHKLYQNRQAAPGLPPSLMNAFKQWYLLNT